MRVTKFAVAGFLIAAGTALAAKAGQISSADYASIQAAIDANPGEMIFVANGRHEIDKSLMITTANAGLYGPGTIVQKNVNECLLRIMQTEGVRIEGLTFTRPEGATDTTQEGVFIRESSNVTLDGIRIIDNRGPGGSISAYKCANLTIRDSFIENYKSLFIDDRMKPEDLYGYAFQSIDGTGIKAFHNTGIVIRGNRVVESHFIPSKENVEKLGLGKITKVAEKLGRLAPVQDIKAGYTSNWHQGSAIIVGGLGHSNFTIIAENYIENAAQGIDIHADNVTISNNIVNGGIMGMKAMHGSRNVLIEGNQFLNVDLWGIMLMPGAGSHPARSQKENPEKFEANNDGGTIIANNIISNFGYGPQRWNWGGKDGGTTTQSPIALMGGQLAENPPLKDVLIMGNIVYDTGRDGVIENGEPTVEGPRYQYALYVEQTKEPKPQNVIVRGNIFNAGSKGVANFELPAQ